jgi:16S rRNA (cytosine1402-N4)-methyltransferase
MNHVPVLLHEVIAVFDPKPGEHFIDATLGDGGHSAVLLERIAPDGKLLGLDQDKRQLAVAKERLKHLGSRGIFVCARYSQVQEIAQEHGFTQVDGILFDLGISSRQLSDPRYGLDMADTTALDMRLSGELDFNAADFLNRASEQEIADTLYYYGDRHNSRTLARKIVTYRRKKAFKVAYDLKEAINLWHPAALAPLFQALRIWVNKEYEEIETALPQALNLLKPAGKLAVISFHSGEDRIVKRILRNNRELLEVKPIIRPTYEEIKRNSRSRSATLRIAIKK